MCLRKKHRDAGNALCENGGKNHSRTQISYSCKRFREMCVFCSMMESVEESMGKNRIIAVSGKGGVGKTSVSAAFVRILSEVHPEARILAIDADPAIGLSTALGVEVNETLDDIRKTIITRVENGQPKAAIEMLNEARFRILDTMVENRKFSFLAIGRPEAAGCYCKVNAYLKEVINMLSEDFDYVVIDGEAGIEQINRRVMERVSHLFLITDPSRKGIQVIRTIKKVADELVMYERCGAIINRAADEKLLDDSGAKQALEEEGIELLTVIGADERHAYNDIRGNSVFDLPERSPIMAGARTALEKMNLL